MFLPLLLAAASCALLDAQADMTNQTSDQTYPDQTSDPTYPYETYDETYDPTDPEQTYPNNQICEGTLPEVYLEYEECGMCLSIIEKMKGTHVDFLALGAETSQNDIIFPAVYRNIGQAYNETTGKFTAPMTGTYHFEVSLSPALENVQENTQENAEENAVENELQMIECYLVKNGEKVSEIFTEIGPYPALAVTSLFLNRNDTVNVGSCGANVNNGIQNNNGSYFSGILLVEGNV